MQDFQILNDWHRVEWLSPCSQMYVLDRIAQERLLRDWCNSQFGENGWLIDPHAVWFANPAHATAFALKWL